MKEMAFIWDLDGTLLDSYEEVVSSAVIALKEYGIEKSKEEILDFSIKYSVKDYCNLLEKETGIDSNELYARFHEIQDTRYLLIREEPGACAILSYLKEVGIKNYVFTHRQNNAFQVLENLHMLDYFEEIATIGNGLKRKPDPEGILYLVDKYQLNKEETYYVGDRNIDMVCAKNAGIRRILYCPETAPEALTGSEEFRITALVDLREFVNVRLENVQ